MSLLDGLMDRLFDVLLLRYARRLRQEHLASQQQVDPFLGDMLTQFSRSFMGTELDLPRHNDGDEPLAPIEPEVVYESAQVLEHSLRNAYEVHIALPGIDDPSQVEVRELDQSLEVKARLPGSRNGYFAIVKKPRRFDGSPRSQVEDGTLVLRWVAAPKNI